MLLAVAFFLLWTIPSAKKWTKYPFTWELELQLKDKWQFEKVKNKNLESFPHRSVFFP
jgi:hypothetical protein